MNTTEKVMEKTPILSVEGVSKAFPGVQALTNVDFCVMEGEIHGLVGKNGAGKSTLMAILMGILEPNEGKIIIGDQQFHAMSPKEAIEKGIAYVPQHVAMMDSLTVAENILAGELPKSKLGLVDWKKVNSEAKERLERLGLEMDVTKKVEGLSVAEQTMLAIAKALFGNAKLIILDEPTASLSRTDINRLFSFVKSLKDKGGSFIYISHHLEEVFEICDRVTVLRDGHIVGTAEVAQIDVPKLIVMMVGEDVEDYTRESTCQDQVVMELDGLERRGYYENISLSLRKGEILGLTGLQGCGVEQLGKGLFGLEPRGIGEIVVDNEKFTADKPIDSFNQGLAYLPQDRYRYGLVGLRSVRENVTYPILNKLVRLINLVNRSEEKTIVEKFINELDIKTPSQEQPARLLSGGNQQKVVFAKLASTQPSVLVLHEPTQGVDVRAKMDIFRIIDDMAAQGVAIIIISTEIRELIGVCDRIMVMNDGRMTHEFKKGEKNMTPETILAAIEGGRNNE
ncbi:MAG: simple sugar transport system ATP-binding protein [Chloroflexota bacterium]|nr:simple sugar transport system ATP-binding protein [Chloroflexota bacterium]